MFAIRSTRAGTEGLLAEAQQAIWSVNGRQPVFLVTTLKALYDQSMARTSFTLVMLAIAGGMALVIGIVGIYGVIAYVVSQRTREIGIRTALGAQPAELLGMFVRHGLWLAGVGAALGLVAAAGLTRLMSSLLFGVTALDPVTYAAVSALLDRRCRAGQLSSRAPGHCRRSSPGAAGGLAHRAPRDYLSRCTRSFSFSLQTDSRMSVSGCSSSVTVMVKGVVYILGSSMVTLRSMWPKSRR